MVVIIDAVSRGIAYCGSRVTNTELLQLCNVHENIHQEIENGLTLSDFIGIPRRYALGFFPKKLHQEA